MRILQTSIKNITCLSNPLENFFFNMLHRYAIEASPDALAEK